MCCEHLRHQLPQEQIIIAFLRALGGQSWRRALCSAGFTSLHSISQLCVKTGAYRKSRAIKVEQLTPAMGAGLLPNLIGFSSRCWQHWRRVPVYCYTCQFQHGIAQHRLQANCFLGFLRAEGKHPLAGPAEPSFSTSMLLQLPRIDFRFMGHWLANEKLKHCPLKRSSSQGFDLWSSDFYGKLY